MTLARLSTTDWPAFSALLDEALALPADAREGWVSALAGERARHRDALRALLAQSAQLETVDFLGTLPRFAALDAADPLLAAGGPAADERVGPYRLLRELGTGGMGAVWLAERADGALTRTVALKLPRVTWDPDIARRVARERDILAALEHPNIARLYDAGLDAQGRPYLAMEYVDGTPVDAYCRAQRLPLPARVALLLQVAQAVAYAHRRLVVHRDLKPSNILVTADGQVRLLDFGIARLVAPDGAVAEATLAAPALTPGYASPEQLRGQALSTATDVYSLGVVAHELLIGVRPFDHLAERGLMRMQAIAARDPPRPSALLAAAPAAAAAERASTPRAWRRQVAGDLDAILLRALARTPEERYPSVEAFAEDLARWRAGRPVAARRPTRGYLLRKFVQRHRLAVAAGSAATLALMASATAALVMGLQAREQAQRAQAARDFLVGLFERADPDLRGGRDATARELLTPAEADAARLPPSQRREVLQTVATLWTHFGDLERAAAAQARLSADLEAQGGEALARSRLEQARLAMLAGDLDDSERFLAAALGGRESIAGPPALRAQAAEQAGWLQLYRGRAADAAARFAEAAAQAARADDADRRVAALYGLVHAQQGAGAMAAALATLRTLAALDGAPGLSERAQQVRLTALSTAYYALGRYADGWPYVLELTRRADALYGREAAAQLRQRIPWLRYALRLGREREAAAWVAAHPLDTERMQRAGGLRDERLDWLTLLARLHAALGDRPASASALAQARTLLAELPADAQPAWRARIALAESLAWLSLGDPARAAQQARAAAEQAGVDADVAAMLTFAQAVALARQGDWREVDARLAQAQASLEDGGDLLHTDAALLVLDRALVAARGDAAALARVKAMSGRLALAAETLATGFGTDHPVSRRARRVADAAGGPPTTTDDFLRRLRDAAGDDAARLFI